jgi:beta-glucuronidase
MERLFQTHRFRKSCALAPTWTLRTLDAGGLDRPEKVLVPGVWESHPALRCYRGRGIYEQEIECGGNLRFWFVGVSS